MDKKPRLQTLPYVYFKFFLGYPSLYHLLSTRAYSRGKASCPARTISFER